MKLRIFSGSEKDFGTPTVLPARTPTRRYVPVADPCFPPRISLNAPLPIVDLLDQRANLCKECSGVMKDMHS